ncbi:hypothetical protein CLIB1423_02S00474 [[Candida] railenensis]|uniref:Uncharacterized protein n=1 Tax=[Candida] railenensis TaxID=45579 RepID=A0A9P0QK29_9ASCO|nr:hypothetical protein CLIB1423_02S00474 [[Candida] railenensis]
MYCDLEDSLEEFDIRYIEACNQVNLDVDSILSQPSSDSANVYTGTSVVAATTAATATATATVSASTAAAAGFGKSKIGRSNSISSQTKKLTLSSPLLANKELSNFTCYDKKQRESTLAFNVDVSPTSTQPPAVSYTMKPPQKQSLTNSVPPLAPPILTIDSFQKPFEFRSHSLSTSPQIHQRRTTVSSNTPPITGQPPLFRRRATYSSASSIGNPFYKPSTLHKKEVEQNRPSTSSSSPSFSNKNSITSSFLDDSTLNSLLETDFLSTSIQKKRKVSSDSFSLESFFTSEIALDEEFATDFVLYQDSNDLSGLASDAK